MDDSKLLLSLFLSLFFFAFASSSYFFNNTLLIAFALLQFKKNLSSINDTYYASIAVSGMVSSAITLLVILSISTLVVVCYKVLSTLTPPSFTSLISKDSTSLTMIYILPNLHIILPCFLVFSHISTSLHLGLLEKFLRKLVSLDLSMNAKLQIQPYVLNNLLQNSTHLREHLISGVDIGWALPTFLNISSSLKSLDLSRTSLHGNLPCNIFSLRYLEKLYLSNNDILGPLPQVIINQSSFKSLDLSNNGLQGKLPNNIFNIKYSEILDLSHNNNLPGLLPKINQSISIHLKCRLTTIRLSDNILNGTLLFSLFTLPLLEDDYVGNNMLSGGLPKELFNYGSLKRLFLALSKIKRDYSLLTITLMHVYE
ncbi:hypothetical protein Lser_V15G08971 [Lactuca serriola]